MVKSTLRGFDSGRFEVRNDKKSGDTERSHAVKFDVHKGASPLIALSRNSGVGLKKTKVWFEASDAEEFGSSEWCDTHQCLVIWSSVSVFLSFDACVRSLGK